MTQATHSLKLLTENEREDVVRMALAFFEASPYAKYGIDTVEVNSLVSTFMNNPADKTCFLLMVNEKPAGILAAISSKNIFNQYKICAEVMWWIDPEYRSFQYASKMLAAYEYWAKYIVGAQIVQLVCLDEQLHAMYTRRGYTRAELGYVKEIK